MPRIQRSGPAWLLVALVAAVTATFAAPPGPPTAEEEDARALPDLGGRLPDSLVRVATDGVPTHLLVVEKSSQTLLVFDCSQQGPVLVRRLPCTTGKNSGDKVLEGDLKTPEGVYWFTRYIDGDSLPALYGAGAFVMDYPNRFDRLSRKTGGGIWLHGVETNDRVHVRQDTRGCVAVRNDHFEQLRALVRLHDTPIVVVDTLQLAPRETLAADARLVTEMLEDWRSAWQGKDLERYLRHYDGAFESEGRNLKAWAAHKRDLAERYGTIRVSLGPPTLLREKGRLWIRFRQEYASDQHVDVGTKLLTLRADASRPDGWPWRIVGEDWAALRGELPPPLPAAPPAAPLPAPAPRSQAPATLVAMTEAVPARRVAVAAPHGDVPPPAAVVQAPVVAELQPAAVPAIPEVRLAEAPSVPSPSPANEAQEAAPSVQPPVMADLQPPEPEPTRAHAAAPLPFSEARAEDPRLTRGPFRLATPFVRRVGADLELSVQLLNTASTITRDGTIDLALTVPGLGTMEEATEKFSTRQGLLLARRVPAPTTAGRLTLRVQVKDAAERLTLDQDVVVDVLP